MSEATESRASAVASLLAASLGFLFAATDIVLLIFFQQEIATALGQSMRNPAAATCSDRDLLLALARYDRPDPNRVRVEELALGAMFRTDCGMLFHAGPKLRSRRQCFECRTGREYRVHGLARVELVTESPG